MDDTENCMMNVLQFTNRQQLQAEVEKLRDRLSELVFEFDNLIYHECKDIEARYMMAVGALEYRAYSLECDVLRCRRKAEMIQAQLNRQKPVIIAEINIALDKEFAAYNEKVEGMKAQISNALERSNAARLSVDATLELKRIYRALVKALHPDLHPDESEARQKLFMQTVDAYERGSLAELQLIEALAGTSDADLDAQDSGAALLKEKGRLTGLVDEEQKKILTVKLSFPYKMKDFLNDAAAVAAHKAELESYIARLEDALEVYKLRVEQILR